jgi:hypothetical protein
MFCISVLKMATRDLRADRMGFVVDEVAEEEEAVEKILLLSTSVFVCQSFHQSPR